MPFSVVTSSFSEAGASLASALAIFSEKLSLRKLPTMVTILWVAMGFPWDFLREKRNAGFTYARTARPCKCMHRAIWETLRSRKPVPNQTGRPCGRPVGVVLVKKSDGRIPERGDQAVTLAVFLDM